MISAATQAPSSHRRPRPARPTTDPQAVRPRASERFRRIRELEIPGGPPRELIARRGAAGSTLVIDRDAETGHDERLLAHLPADEPAGNAALICSLYAEAETERRHCRRVTELDEIELPLADAADQGPPEEPVEGPGGVFHLVRMPSRMSIPELRWTQRADGACSVGLRSLREVIAALEDYEPARSMTAAAIARHARDEALSTTTLRCELARVLESPIVLNRGLREAVLERVERERSSLSEIAIRCGRVKRDSRGGQSGETSWLARRIGLLPEGGQSEPTVWVHSSVLGLISREGLGVSPREVELG